MRRISGCGCGAFLRGLTRDGKPTLSLGQYHLTWGLDGRKEGRERPEALLCCHHVLGDCVQFALAHLIG